MNKRSSKAGRAVWIYFIMTAASLLLAVNIKTFVRTGGLYPGGATGCSILIQRALKMYLGLDIPYTAINIPLNAIPIYIGFRYIGKKFTFHSCYVIVLTSILTDALPSYAITYDTLLISIFGGMINGFCISLCLLNDSTTGGTDFIGIYLSEKKGIDSFNIILIFNAVILCIAGLMSGWDKALYSIIYQYVSTIVLRALYRKYQEGTLFIVTNKPQEICSVISAVSNHGATIIKGVGSYNQKERDVVYSVVSSAEAREVIKAVKGADPEAFVNLLKTQEVSGRFYHKPED